MLNSFNILLVSTLSKEHILAYLPANSRIKVVSLSNPSKLINSESFSIFRYHSNVKWFRRTRVYKNAEKRKSPLFGTIVGNSYSQA